MKAAVAAEVRRIDESYTRLYDADRKTFALRIQHTCPENMAPHMSRWGGKCDGALSWLASQRKGGTWSDTFLDGLLDRIGAPELAVSEAA
jgi:hypothetical protein